MFHRRAEVVSIRNQNLTGREAVWSGELSSWPFVEVSLLLTFMI